jgi:hypothetical protein
VSRSSALAVSLILFGLSFGAGCASPNSTSSRCSDCPDGLVCDADLATCVRPAVVDGGCLGSGSCAVPTGLCRASDGRCVGCLSNTDCAGGACDVTTGACVATAAERCAGVTRLLELTSGALRVRGTTAGFTHDTRLSCALPGSVGPDVVYGLRVTERQRLSATVRPLDPASGFQPVVGLRAECAREGPETACGFPTVGSDQAALVADGLAPGLWFLWVDSETAVGGAYELELSVDLAPSIDSCSAPGVLRGGELIEVAHSTAGLADDFSSGCGGPGAPDAVYRLTLDRPRRVRLEAIGSMGFRPLLSLRGTCSEAASELACAVGVASTATATIELPFLEAGSYWVVIDGASSSGLSGGRFRLQAMLSEPVSPPTNEACATAALLQPSASPIGRLSLQGDTSRARNDAAGCEGTGPDLVYAIELPVARRMVAQVTPLSGSRLQPVLYLRQDMKCESSQARDQLACTSAGQAGFPAQLEVPGLEAGRWFLFVDGRFGTSGAFELQLDFTPPTPPPSNDTCSMATPLNAPSGMTSLVSETTVGASHSAVTCAVPTATPDVAYALTVTSRQSVSIEARATTGSPLLPVLTLKPVGPCAITAALPLGHWCGLSDDQRSDRAVLALPLLEPGTYTLWVSGDRQTQGPFSLRVLTGPPVAPASNDTCPSSGSMPGFSLGPASSTTGDTRGATDGAEGACGLPSGANGEFGGDVVFTLQVTTQGPVTITVTPDAIGGELFRPVVYIRGGPGVTACTAQGPNLGCQAAPDLGQPVTLTLPNVAPGLYSVWVDGAGTSAGRFSLTVR